MEEKYPEPLPAAPPVVIDLDSDGDVDMSSSGIHINNAGDDKRNRSSVDKRQVQQQQKKKKKQKAILHFLKSSDDSGAASSNIQESAIEHFGDSPWRKILQQKIPHITTMESVSGRLNVILTYSITILIGMSLVMAFSSNFIYRSEEAVSVRSIQISGIHQLKNMPYSGNDKAVLALDLDADLSDLWHWNIKQLFVYLVAEYESENVRRIETFDEDNIDDDDDDEWMEEDDEERRNRSGENDVITNRKTRFVLWDKIVRTKERSQLTLRKQRSKYALVDVGANLRSKAVSLHLEWTVIPYIGQMYTQRAEESSTIILPKKYLGNTRHGYDPDDYVPRYH